MSKSLRLNTFGAMGLLVALTSMPHQASADAGLQSLLERKAATIERLHFKAKKALVTAAQDETFAQYHYAHSDEEKTTHKSKIDQISLSVQDRFQVEEMCLIDPNGAEISRIVGKKIADDLAEDEASASFFAPGFAAAPRKVHVSPTYMSADADKWVVAYVTPLVVDGKKTSILHYEHTLAVYQTALNRDMADSGSVMLAVDADGYIVSDSRADIAIDIKDGAEDRKTYFKHFDLAGMSLDDVRKSLGSDRAKGSGTITASGKAYDVAYKAVGDWTIVAIKGL